MKVCTFGSYKELSVSERQEVINLGRLLAESGHVVISGGFGGTMEDISRGAKSGGGRTVGVTYYKKTQDGLRDGRSANAYIDEEIVAVDIFDRIKIMLENSDAFILFSGGTGTLLELAAVVEYMNKGLMAFKPFIAMGSYWKPIFDILRKEPLLNDVFKREYGFLNCADLITFASNAREVLDRLVTTEKR